jgi:uncharacterized membrane protein
MKTKSKTYRIRYNTFSKTDNERWRLIEDGKEILVSDVIVNGHTRTTQDWIPEINDFKWHVSCTGHCIIINNIAYVTTIKEESIFIRHILKALTYRFISTILTVSTAYLVGVSIEVSALIGIGELLVKPIIYFLHERAWYKFIKIKKNEL